jgi:hypothetical protein
MKNLPKVAVKLVALDHLAGAATKIASPQMTLGENASCGI